MQRDKPPFNADHVGSLVRPQALIDAWEGRRQGKMKADEFRHIQQDAIRQVVARQEELGLQLVTDVQPGHMAD